MSVYCMFSKPTGSNRDFTVPFSKQGRVVCIMAADGVVHHQIMKCSMHIFYF